MLSFLKEIQIGIDYQAEVDEHLCHYQPDEKSEWIIYMLPKSYWFRGQNNGRSLLVLGPTLLTRSLPTTS